MTNMNDMQDFEFYDELSVAAAEVRDAMECDFSQGAVDALKNRVEELLRTKR